MRMSTEADDLAQGWRAHQAGDVVAGERAYRRVLARAPRNADAWCYLGMACHDQERWDEAIAAYRRALEIRPDFAIVHNNLGNTLRMQRLLRESVASFDRAIRLKPDYVNAYKNKGTALLWEGHIDEAMACYERALTLAPDDAEVRKNLGVIRLLQGDFERGWREYEWRARAVAGAVPSYERPRWNGSPLDGRTTLLAAEQGLGDTVHFIRYAAVLKARSDCRVIAACQRPLLPLLATCPGIDHLVAQDDPPPRFDVWAPLLSLPGLLRHHAVEDFPASVPYLFPPPALTDRWRTELSVYGGVRIGIAWQGNPKHQADRMRSVPLAEFAPLASLEGLRLLSLQKGPGTDQLEGLAQRLGIVPLHDRLDATAAFVDTAAVMQHLDLVITSDTAVAHLAGALGVPVWVALYHVPDWRWLLGRDDSPWYPTMRLFRQTAVGDWPGVFARIVEALRARFPSLRRS